MKCKYPTVFPSSKGVPVKCSRCRHCRINKRNEWTHRIILESMQHASSVFLTLTYNNDNLPSDEFYHPNTGQVYAPFSVCPDHHRLFINNLRYHSQQKLGVSNLRFYGIGEYGENLERPHYHYALFGFPPCTSGARYIGRRFYPCQCPSCQLISDTWGKGNIFSGQLTLASASYIADYLNKNLTHDSDYRQAGYTGLTNAQKLRGRHPEFARMSNRPGIGAWAADGMADKLKFYNTLGTVDIPKSLIHAGRHLPLGRYLTDRLYEKMGKTFEPNERLEAYERSLFNMFLSPKVTPQVAKISMAAPSLALSMLNSQYHVNLEAKAQLFKKEKLI